MSRVVLLAPSAKKKGNVAFVFVALSRFCCSSNFASSQGFSAYGGHKLIVISGLEKPARDAMTLVKWDKNK